MPRKPSAKPWLHSSSGYWCTSTDDRRVYLDKDYRVACLKLRELRAKKKREQAGGPDWLDAPFAVLADEFLTDVQARRAESTYESYRYRLERALRILGTTLRVAELRKFHLANIEREMTARYSPTTVRDTIAAVQSVTAWAARHDLIEINVLAGFQKPAARSRTRIIEPAEFQAMLRVSDPNFRRVLLALRLTGARPGEVRSLIWEWVDLARGFWVFPKHKTITTQRQPRPRIVALAQPVWSLCRWLAQLPHHGTDFVFKNRHGRSYSKDCFVRKMQRIRERAGIKQKGGENLVLYSARHSLASETCGKVSDTELAELLGHQTNRLIHRYVHLSAERLDEIRRRALR